MADTSKLQASSEPSQMGCLGLVVRLSWMVGGNLALVLLAILIGEKGAFSALDAVFWSVVLGLVVLRYLDITRLKGLTKNNEPATLGHWRRYTVYLVLVASVLWGAAHALGSA